MVHDEILVKQPGPNKAVTNVSAKSDTMEASQCGSNLTI